jgi:2-dehydro-3-deoxygluconokinase
VPEDHATPPDAFVRQVLLDCSDEDWARTQAGPTGVRSPALVGGVV